MTSRFQRRLRWLLAAMSILRVKILIVAWFQPSPRPGVLSIRPPVLNGQLPQSGQVVFSNVPCWLPLVWSERLQAGALIVRVALAMAGRVGTTANKDGQPPKEEARKAQ